MSPGPLFTDSLAKRFVEAGRVGEKYRPSNGSEGEMFAARWCEQCEADRAYRDGTGESCEIIARTMVFDTDEADYPREWQYDATGQPCCTAFVAAVERSDAEGEGE